MEKSLILLSLIMAVLIVPSASAASFELGVEPSKVSVCPCSSITPELVSVDVKNLLDAADTYVFSMNVPAEWKNNQNRIELEKAVGPGQEQELDLFLINPGCDAVPGTYTVTINAVSGQTGDRISRTLEIEILKCYGVTIDVDEAFKETCVESREPVEYDISVANTGKFAETFALTSSVDWASLSDSSVTLDAGESRLLKLVLNPPEGLTGLQTVTIKAKLERTSAIDVSDSATVQLNIEKCFGFDAAIQPDVKSACKGTAAEYTILLKNRGHKDTYVLTAPEFVQLSEKEVTLEASETKEITAAVTPEEEGRLGFDIQVTPESNPANSLSLKAYVDSAECRGVAVILSPEQSSVCEGLETEFNVVVKNTGMVQEDVSLKSNYGVMEQENVTLGMGETASIKLNVDTSGISEKVVDIMVTATADGASDQSAAKLTLETCYSSELSITPGEGTVCAGSVANYTVKTKNIGELKDDYLLTVKSSLLESDITHEFTLEPGEEESLDVSVPVDSDQEEGTYEIRAMLVSESGQAEEANASITVKSRKTCFSVGLSNGGAQNVVIGKAVAVPITVNNSGELPDTYQLTFQGPEWLYISPDSVKLDSGEQETVYLYISPVLEAEPGAYTARIIASSANTVSELEIPIIIGGEEGNKTVTVPGNVSGTEENATSGVGLPEINITIGGGNITGLLTGENRDIWRVAAVAAITLVIIAILIARFILLVKK